MTKEFKKMVDLGDEPSHEIEFKIGDTTFKVFPLDEIEIIHGLAEADEKIGKPESLGEEFWLICQSRLAKHGVRASLMKSGQWYTALCNAYQEQVDFFAGSPDSSDSTDSAKTGDDPINSPETNSNSSRQSKTQSKPRKSRKTS